MSNFIRRTKNPRTGVFEDASWIDNYYGPRQYAVRFPDGSTYREDPGVIKWEFEDIETPHPAKSDDEPDYPAQKREKERAMTNQQKQEELKKKIGKAADLSRSNGWYFDKTGDKLNASHKVLAIEKLINSEVLAVIEELESEQETEAKAVDGEVVTYVPLSALQTIKERYTK